MTINRRSRRQANQPRSTGRSNGDQEGLPQDEGETPQNSGGPPNSGGTPSGVRVEWLDPKAIQWPAKRITSEYTPEMLVDMGVSLGDGSGQEDPLIVRQLPDGIYEGAGGQNRCLAAINRGIAQIMCIVRPGTHLDVVRANLRTGVQQSRPNAYSEVEGIAEALEQGMTVEEIMADTGKSQGWVEDRLAISEASQNVKDFLRDNMIGIGVAAMLARVEDLEEQDKFLQDVVAGHWTVNELREAIDGVEDPEPENDEADDPGTHPVNFEASNQPRERQRKTANCIGCGEEDENQEFQTGRICPQCLEAVERVRSVPAMRKGIIYSPVTLVEESINLLAGFPLGAKAAEQWQAILDRAGEREEK